MTMSSEPIPRPQLRAVGGDGFGRLVALLDAIVAAELNGACRYNHWAATIEGPHRLSLAPWLAAQAFESLTRAQAGAELSDALGGHPPSSPGDVRPCVGHSPEAILHAAEEHERGALTLYRTLMDSSEGESLVVEEFARATLAIEEHHVLELVRLQRSVP